MDSTSAEVAANVLLRERAARQSLVDRLQANSFWATFGGRMVLPAGTAALLLGINAIWSGGPAASTLLAVAVAGVFWLSVELAQLNRRVHAVAAVLDSTGVLEAFISSNEIQTTRSNKPLQPTSGGRIPAE